jgi:hypothetical protein
MRPIRLPRIAFHFIRATKIPNCCGGIEGFEAAVTAGSQCLLRKGRKSQDKGSTASIPLIASKSVMFSV